jgi:hypothetical protein
LVQSLEQGQFDPVSHFIDVRFANEDDLIVAQPGDHLIESAFKPIRGSMDAHQLIEGMN